PVQTRKQPEARAKAPRDAPCSRTLRYGSTPLHSAVLSPPSCFFHSSRNGAIRVLQS
uniref:Uncharacterized protein n=1 Tax=Aegilops tauschii subsp. strangulata TaxID=200361 RepID=A0A453S6I3_AEGTS